jgi:hypothetical protein
MTGPVGQTGTLPWVAGIAESLGAALPRIDVNQQLSELVVDAVDALVRQNANAPVVFRYADSLARVARFDDDDALRPRIKTYDAGTLIGELARAAVWFTMTQQGERAKHPDKAVAAELLGASDRYTDIPVLENVVGCPVFGADGTLYLAPGYCAATRCWYEPVGELDLDAVPDTPAPEDVGRARLILEDFLGDFPFEEAADFTHAVGFMITLVARRLVHGHVPLHGVEAPTEGTGKTLLVQSMLLAVNGVTSALLTPPDRAGDDEWDKRIVSSLMTGHNAMVWDNVNYRLGASSLAKLVTTNTYGGRLLGQNRMLELPVRSLVIYTGNNVRLTREVARRTVLCRLNTHSEQPGEGRVFRHSHLERWVTRNRGEILWALYVLVRAWVSAGRPGFTGQVLASFEDWSRVVGGVLEHAGFKGFLGNRPAIEVNVDEGSGEPDFARAWYETHGEDPVLAKQLAQLAYTHLGIEGKHGGYADERVVGRVLGKLRDRVIDGYEIKIKSLKPTKYQVVQTLKK